MDFFQRLGNFFTGKGWINDDEKRRKEQQVQPQVVQQNNIQPQLNNTNRVLNAGYGMNGVENRQRLLNGSNANPSPSSNPLQQANQATQQLNLNSQNNQLKPQVTVNDAPKVFNSQGQQDWANNQNKQIQVQNAVNKPIQPQQPAQQPKPQLVQPQQQKPQVQPQTSKPQPTFFDYLNPLGKYGLFGAENQKNFSNVIKPATDAIQRYEDTVDKGDKQQGFQWDDPMDYLRFGAKLPSGMARGVMEAPNKISAGISGVRVNDQGKVEDLNALQRIGSAADGGIDLFGVPFGGSGTLVKSVLKQGGEEAVKQSAKQIAKQAWQQKVIDTAKHIGSDAIKEGAEETIQSFAGDLADDGKLNTDWRQHASAGALGALGGGMMSTAGKGINATRNKVFSNQQATNNDVDITKPGRLEQEALVQRQNQQQSQQPIQPQQQSQTQTQTTTNTATIPVNNQQTGYSSFFRRPAENNSIRQAAEVNIANNQNNQAHPIQSVDTNQAIQNTMPNASPALKQAVSQNISDIQRGDTNAIAARRQTTGRLENYLVEQATQGVQNRAMQDVRYKMVPNGTNLYHGSPHKFNKFSTDNIGSGEGNQSFGWGLYFTDNKGIGEHYADIGNTNNRARIKNNLSSGEFRDSLYVNKDTMSDELQRFLSENGYNITADMKPGELARQVDSLRQQSQYYGKKADEMAGTGFDSDFIAASEKYNNLASELEQIVRNSSEKRRIAEEEINQRVNDVGHSRNLYNVDLASSDGRDFDFLSWYDTVDPEQKHKIKQQAIVENLTDKWGTSVRDTESYPNSIPFDADESGASIYHKLQSEWNMTPKETSLFLNRAGIDGIIYPADSLFNANNRDLGRAESTNYVVFDENNVKVRDYVKFKKQEAHIQKLVSNVQKKGDLIARHLDLTGDERLVFNEWQNEIQRRAAGYYLPDSDTIDLNRLSEDTLNHELGHKLLERTENKPELLNAIRQAYGDDYLVNKYGRQYGNDINLLAEEQLADGFSEYYHGRLNGEDKVRLGVRLGIPKKILAVYDRITEAIMGLVGKQDVIKQFYAQMETGKFRNLQQVPGGDGRIKRMSLDSDVSERAVRSFNSVRRGKQIKSVVGQLSEDGARKVAEALRSTDFNKKARLIINKNAVNHLRNSGHLTGLGKNGADANPLTEADIRALPHVFSDPDVVYMSGTGRTGKRMVFERQLDNHHRIVAELEYSGKDFNLVTYFNINKDLPNDKPAMSYSLEGAVAADESGRQPSRPGRSSSDPDKGFNDNIPNTPQNVNNANRYKLEEDDSFYDKPRPSVQDVWGTNSVSLEYSQDENGNLGINVTPENTNDPNSITHIIQETPTDSKSPSAQRTLIQADRRSLHETVESQPLNQNQAQEFKNVPMEEEHLLTKGNLYEQTKPGINDTWNRAFRDGMYEYRQHTKRTRDGKKHFVSFERRYVGDNGEYGDWMPTSRAAYIWKSQTKKIDKVNRDQIIQEALKVAKQDGEVQEFMAYKNPDSAGGVAVVPLVGEHSIDGGFVRNPKTGAIEGNYIQVTPFGVVHQTNGKFDVIEADHLTNSLDKSKGGITDAFNRLVEKNIQDKVGQRLLKDLYYQKTEAYANYADEINNLLDKHATLAKHIDKARPRFVSSKKFWEDIGAYTEGKFPVGSADENMNVAFSKKYGPQAAKRVREYDTFMRNNYDAMISNLNSVRRMYGKEEIPYLKNYMPHIQKRSNILGRAVDKLLAAVPTGVRGDMEGQARGEIPAAIAGLSVDFKPTHKFNANEKRRFGGMMSYEKDPRKAFEYYADVMLYNTHMEPVIARGRQIESSMRAIDMAKKSGTNIDPDSNLAKGDKISSKATIAVQNFVNEMAGKSSSLDRPYIDQTNKWVQSIQRLESVNGANKILGNLSSTLAQTLNLPETVRDNGLRSTGRAFLTAFDKSTKEAMRKSPFLRERYTDTDGKFTRSRYQKATDKISVVSGMNLVEKKFIQLNWAANYYSAQRKGLTGYQLIKAADQATERAVGGRGIGAMPQVYKSTLGKMFLQFTYETNESWKNNIANVKRFGSEIRQLQFKDAGGTATRAAEAFAVAYGMNMLIKLVTGNEPLANMYDAIKDVLSNDADDDGEDDKLGQKIARIGSEMSKMNPVTSAALNLIPKSEREKMFGKSSDLGRFDGATGVAQTAANILGAGFYATQGDSENTQKNLQGLIPVGNQIKKTMSGIKVLQDGGDVYTDKNGKEHTNFEVDSGNAWNQAKALLFGKNALRPDEKSASTSTAAGDDTGKTIKDFERGLKKGTYKIQDGLLVNKSGNVQRSYYKSLAEGQGVSDEAYSNWMKAYNIDGASTIKKEFSSSNDILNKLENSEKKANKSKSAVDILMGKHKDLPDWVRERYYRESGYTKEQIEYGAMTTHKEVSLMDNYWRQKAQESSHEELMQALTNGRRKSITGQMFAKNGIINKLRAEGYITKWEAKALNAAQFDVDGNRITKEASGGSSRSGSGRSRGGRGDRSANSGIASIGIKAAANISSYAAKANQTSVQGMNINQIGQNLISKMNTQKQVNAALKQWKSPRIRVKKA